MFPIFFFGGGEAGAALSPGCSLPHRPLRLWFGDRFGYCKCVQGVTENAKQQDCLLQNISCIVCMKNNKMPEFYMIFARKIFSRFLFVFFLGGGVQMTPAPRLLRHVLAIPRRDCPASRVCFWRHEYNSLICATSRSLRRRR